MRFLSINIILICFFISIINAQVNNVNNSFIHTNFLTGNGGAVSYITATTDGGFAYIAPALTFCTIASDFTKFDMSSKCYEGGTGNKKYSKLNRPDCKNARALIFKVNARGKIQWVKSLYNECFSYDYGSGGGIKQTKDKGFITFLTGRIIKLDSIGNIKWKLYYDRDSMPEIKKTEFLCKAGASDVYECKDGSFIALLSASFSLLKISKDGKPLWLKSTVFDEFNPIYIEYFSYQDSALNNADTLTINKFIWQQGGGVYIPTYNVYETDNGGYMAIGQNMYRDKNNIISYSKDSEFINKKYCTKDSSNKRIIVSPEKVYMIRNFAWGHPLKDYEKMITARKYTTVVVKTDKNGNVLWTKQFGDMSYDTSPHSDLIKLANGKWLVRIRDCDSTGLDNYGKVKFGSPHSEFYIMDDNGNILKKPNFSQSKYMCDPFSMAMASDSSFYFYEQDIVSKADKNMSIQWQKSFGGWLTDVGIHAITADTGVLSTERGVIYKFNSLGKSPKDSVAINISQVSLPSILTQTKPYLHFDFNFPSRIELCNIVIERKDIKEIENEDFVRYTYMFAENPYTEQALGYKKKYELSKKKKNKIYEIPWYMFINEVNIGRYDPTLKSYVLDINDTCQLRGMFCEQKKDTLPAVMVDIPYLYGYREVYLTDLAEGDYVCKILDKETSAVLWKKEFTWKP